MEKICLDCGTMFEGATSYCKKCKAKAYRQRGKRVKGGYLDMNAEIVKFGQGGY